jgi:hypothetical protein
VSAALSVGGGSGVFSLATSALPGTFWLDIRAEVVIDNGRLLTTGAKLKLNFRFMITIDCGVDLRHGA